MKHQVFPNFNDIFPNQMEVNFTDLLSKVSSKEILKQLSRINRDLFLKRNNTNTHERILIELCRNINENDKQNILNNYNSFTIQKRNSNPIVIIFLETTILDFILEVLKNTNSIEYKESDKDLLSITILKGLLICNSIYERKQVNILKDGINPKSDFIAGIHQFNFSAPRDIYYLINLSSELFSFLENSLKLNTFLTEFLVRMKIEDYRAYINVVISVSIEILIQKNYRLSLNNYYRPLLEGVLEYLSIDFTNNSIDELPKNFERDYKILREKPILKISENTYCIFDQNLLLDKLYIGIIFDIYYNTTLKGRKDLYKNFEEFLGDLGTAFAEKKLFYKIIPNCFLDNSNSVIIPGDSFQEEYSDYYVRENNNLFLFEFKNYIINADIKNSLDYDKIFKEITKKFYEEEVRNKRGELIKIKSKGVKQLINSINQINKGGYHFDNFKEKINSKLYIYPILVYTDEFFNVNGMHKIVDKYYENEITASPKSTYQVNRLILISLYDLIRVSYTINKRRISFAFLLDLYHERIKELSRLSRIKNSVLTIPHFTDLINDQLLELDLAAAEALTDNVLGNGMEIMTGLIFDQSNMDMID